MDNSIVSKNIKAGKIMKGYSNKELAIKMHLTENQLYYRLKHPERMTLKDMRDFGAYELVYVKSKPEAKVSTIYYKIN